MTTNRPKTAMVTADDPVFKAMQELEPVFMSAAQHFGPPVALEALGNLLIMNLAAFYGEKVAMATLGDIAANAAPVARQWSAFAASAEHEPGHA